MERVIEIIEEWGFKEGTKGHYYKFVTPDSYVVFYFTEDDMTITFMARCGKQNKERINVEESCKMSKSHIIASSKDGLKFFIKGEILRLAVSAHRKYIFN